MPETVTLRIDPGRAKDGSPESFEPLEFRSGEVVALVGPTGSGKTRLLADVERLTTGDSPTARRVTLTGAPEGVVESGFAVARITQSMQFFLDLTAGEFVDLHARARGREGGVGVEVIQWANRLAGEPFDAAQPLASLSGGQTRALMVADVVLVSDAPVLLIDEIENAGIDRHAALDFLIRKGRLVFVATHDPLIALRARCRLVLAGGAIRQVRPTSAAERRLVVSLSTMDRKLSALRDRLRRGEGLR